MPWQTPTLEGLRALNRDSVTAQLRSGPMIPNSVLRVISDANAGLAYLVLLYLDWLSKQFLPDTAEIDWLERWANLFLTNADGSKGRKIATYASGSVAISGIAGTPVPAGAVLNAQAATPAGGFVTVQFQTTAPATAGVSPVAVPVVALTAGAAGNLDPGTTISFQVAIAGINGAASVVTLSGGSDQETVDEMRVRVLARLQQPPMGGDAEDYVQWAMSFPGVTRAWCSPLEMGIGTVTLRFMMDDLRADAAGFPNADDVAALQTWMDSRRPVTVLDLFVLAPRPEPISFTLSSLVSDDAGTLANIEKSVTAMLTQKASPAYAVNGVPQAAQTIYSVWVSDAVINAVGVTSFDITMADHPMPTAGSLAVLGDIVLGAPPSGIGPSLDYSSRAGSQYVPILN